MKYLVDTMVLIRAAGLPGRVSATAREIIEDEQSEMYWSAVSTAELAIKSAIGKLRLGEDVLGFVHRHRDRLGLQSLVLRDVHAAELEHLPLHHRDPFDRLLIAQARVEGLPVITADPAFDAYEVDVVW